MAQARKRKGRAAGFRLPAREAQALTEKFAPAVERAKRVTALKKVRDFLSTNDLSTARFVQGMIEAERAHVDTRAWTIPHRVMKAMVAVDEGKHRVPRERVSLMTPVPVAARGHARGRVRALTSKQIRDIAEAVTATASANASDSHPGVPPGDPVWEETYSGTVDGCIGELGGPNWANYAPRQLTDVEAAHVREIIRTTTGL